MGREARKLGRRGVSSSMTSGRRPLWGSVLFLSAALLLAGCPKKPEVQTGGPGAAGAPAVAKPGAPGERPKEGRDVFFDFDESVLRPDAKVTLDNNIAWLKANSELRVIVEGHCDERGTNEYNLALGERRAKTVKEYLVAGGIVAERISTISYGEERPFVLGHDESAWKWNRRGHFVVAN
jgi:peptidoglycan-associated lipoprotein